MFSARLTVLTFSLVTTTCVTACVDSADFEQTPASTMRNERPAWVADGKQIVFDSMRDGNHELYIMNVDGTEQTNITNTGTAELFPAVSNSSGEIAFVGEDNGNYDIYVMNLDGSNRRRLTHGARVDDWPSWRDNDQTIIFDYDDDGDFGIVQMNADGSNQRILVDNSARTVDPHTANKSDWIVYSSDELDAGGNDAIFAYNLVSSEVRRLTDLDMDVGAPALSSDGQKIAFNAGDVNWDIHTMNFDGSDIRKLTSNAGDNKWGTFSPDDSEIAFTSNRGGDWNIFLMNANGSNIRQLTGVSGVN